MKKAIFYNVEGTKTSINTDDIWCNGVVDCNNNQYTDEDRESFFWEGEGLPCVPNVEYFNSGDRILSITPAQTVMLLEELEKNNFFPGDCILYKDVEYPGLECFDISLDDIDGIYVVENDKILNISEEEKQKHLNKLNKYLVKKLKLKEDIVFSGGNFTNIYKKIIHYYTEQVE